MYTEKWKMYRKSANFTEKSVKYKENVQKNVKVTEKSANFTERSVNLKKKVLILHKKCAN